jgi:hypothetical protein
MELRARELREGPSAWPRDALSRCLLSRQALLLPPSAPCALVRPTACKSCHCATTPATTKTAICLARAVTHHVTNAIKTSTPALRQEGTQHPQSGIKMAPAGEGAEGSHGCTCPSHPTGKISASRGLTASACSRPNPCIHHKGPAAAVLASLEHPNSGAWTAAPPPPYTC